MSELKLRELSGRAFCGFVEPFRVEFPDHGLVLVKGLNKDTGDTSDAGKSSLILAIQHLLGCAPAPYHGTRLQSWLTEEPMQLSGRFSSGSEDVVLTRGKKFGYQDSRSKISGAEAEAALDTLLGIDRKLLRSITYRAQRSRGVVLGLGDPEKKALLSKLLGVEPYEKVAKEAAAGAAVAEAEHIRYSQILDTASEMLKEAVARHSAAKLGEVVRATKALEQARAQLDGAYAGLQAAKTDQKLVETTERVGVERAVQAATAAEQSAVVRDAGEVSEKLEKCRAALGRCRSLDGLARHDYDIGRLRLSQLVTQVSRAVKQAAACDQESALALQAKAKLELELCPTCERPWADQVATRAKITQLEAQIAKIAAESAAAAEQVKKGLEAQKTLQEMAPYQSPPVIGQLEAEERRLVAAYQEFTRGQEEAIRQSLARVQAAGAAAAATFAEAKAYAAQKVEAAEATYRACGPAVEQASADLREQQRLEAEQKRLLWEMDGAQARYDKVLAEAHDAEMNWNTQRDLQVLVGNKGFLGLIFDEALAEVSAATNDLLSRVANVRHLSFTFKSEKENDSGSVERRITPVVTKGGFEVPLDSGISGGMSSAVELAVDLAFSDVVSRRRGSYPGWLILDEAFDGLGPVSKETCFEMLQVVAAKRLVLVVDHSTAYQGLFDRVINIESAGGRSRIVQTKED
jgi:DNA repair exonuclease SbcCD ATPase subunit